MEMTMYVRTPQAVAWKDSADAPADVASASRSEAANPQVADTRWARTPLQSRRHGRCIALRVQSGQVWVGVAGSPKMRWLLADQVLSDREVAAWLASGF
jgi:hypothetical protein